MLVPLFRSTLLRSTNASVSRIVGLVNGNLLARAPLLVLPLAPSRNLATTPKAKPSSAKKTTTTKGRTAAKKPVAAKKKVLAKKKVSAKKVSAKKRKPAARKKKVVKAKKPKFSSKDWKPAFKKPLSSWTKFVVSQLDTAKTPGKPVVLVDELQAASAKWKNLSEEEKAAYAPSASEVEEYSRKLAEWNATLPKTVRHAQLKHRRARRVKVLRPLPPLNQYIKEEYSRTEFPSDITRPTQRLVYLAKIYKGLPVSHKEALAHRSAEEFRQKQAQA